MKQSDLENILDSLTLDSSACEYWDARIEDVNKTNITFEDLEVTNCAVKPSRGAFLRVFERGFWFYKATTDVADLQTALNELAAQAKSHRFEDPKTADTPYNTSAEESRIIAYEDVRVDHVGLDKKKSVCESYFDIIKEYPQIKKTRVTYADEYKFKTYRSSTGVRFSVDANHCGIAFGYTVAEGDGSFEDRYLTYGSSIEALEGNQEALASNIKESTRFIHAPDIAAGEYPVLMDSEVVGVFAHESFGHKSEADFMLGDENAKEAWKIGSTVGSECLSIYDDGSEKHTSGYCPIDDEGFPTQKTYLIKNGKLTGRLHNHTTARVFEEAPTGNARAMSFEYQPIVRMTNTCVEAGEQSVEELIAGVKDGIYAENFSHGSGLSTFTIAPRRCYLIKNGKIEEPVRVSVISGNVFETLSKIEGCSQNVNLQNSIHGGCGKGEQWPLPVGFGGPQVLVGKMVVS